MNYQDRTKIEQIELESKINSLNNFICENAIFETLDSGEQSRLIDQCAAMSEYNDILKDRIANFIKLEYPGFKSHGISTAS